MPASLLRVLACGSVDDGKSTLIGRLLCECGGVPDDTLESLRRDSRRYGGVAGGIDYALLVDGLAAEREQGITIDVAYRYFETSRRRFILADAPGHEQYTRNMATGASNSDLAVLLVDARKGLLAQTRRHLTIARLLGIRQFILAINKMDLVGFEREPFTRIAEACKDFARRLGRVEITAIPLCALDGENITQPSPRMPWYEGPHLLACLENAEPPVGGRNAPFRMHVQRVLRTPTGTRFYAGTVASGRIRPGSRITNVIGGAGAIVSRIPTMDGDLMEADRGAAITLQLDREIDISRGDVLAEPPLPDIADHVVADVVWMDQTPLYRGRSYQIMMGSRLLTGTVTDIAHLLDIENLEEQPARELRLNEVGRVSIAFPEPVVFEPYRIRRDLGSLILIDRMTHNTVGAAMITGAARDASNIVWARLDIDKTARAALKGQKPAILWFTGLSGAGKSTIANLVEKRLHAKGRHTIVLDGDNVRHGLNRDLGFSEADRVENIRRVAEVAKLFVEAGLIVLVSFISPYRAERTLARERVEDGEFMEIFVDTPVAECRKRDPKGLYARADAGEIRNFTGIDAPYEAPEDPEILLQTLEARPEELADRVVAELRQRGVIT